MPYAEVGATQVAKEQPASKKVMDRFGENLKMMEDRLASIEDRCHKILNLRVPEKEPERKPIQMDADVMQSLNDRVDVFYELNERLNRINRHLSQIVD